MHASGRLPILSLLPQANVASSRPAGDKGERSFPFSFRETSHAKMRSCFREGQRHTTTTTSSEEGAATATHTMTQEQQRETNSAADNPARSKVVVVVVVVVSSLSLPVCVLTTRRREKKVCQRDLKSRGHVPPPPPLLPYNPYEAPRAKSLTRREDDDGTMGGKS